MAHPVTYMAGCVLSDLIEDGLIDLSSGVRKYPDTGGPQRWRIDLHEPEDVGWREVGLTGYGHLTIYLRETLRPRALHVDTEFSIEPLVLLGSRNLEWMTNLRDHIRRLVAGEMLALDRMAEEDSALLPQPLSALDRLLNQDVLGEASYP
jgi:hypothetical protein